MGQENSKVYDRAEITQELDLSFNDITKIPRRIFLLAELQKLILASNKIVEIPKGLGRLKSLTHLDLAGNKLKELPNEFGELVALKHLNLSFNCLWVLPPAFFERLENLETLDLTSNKLWKLDSALFNLKKLQELRIGRNKELVQLPDVKDGSHLEKLRIFVSNENGLTVIPPVIRHMHGISDLDLSKNLITVMSDEIITHLSKLRSLRTLDLSNNKIKAASPAIVELFFLRELNLSYNPIPSFPVKVNSMMNLIFKRQVVQKGGGGKEPAAKNRFSNFFGKDKEGKNSREG